MICKSYKSATDMITGSVRSLRLPIFSNGTRQGHNFRTVRRYLGERYEGRTDCRNPASFAVALYWGIGSSSLKALVKAFERLHMVRAWNSSCTG
jgi:hypothetical protein